MAPVNCSIKLIMQISFQSLYMYFHPKNIEYINKTT